MRYTLKVGLTYTVLFRKRHDVLLVVRCTVHCDNGRDI